MGWQDRDYADSDYGRGPGPMMRGGFMWPRLTPMVKKLLIANIAVFVLYNGFRVSTLGQWGAFALEWAILKGQVWRLITYQYLHGGVRHLFVNMLMLYFFGSLMEQRWGQRRFFLLYSLFGIAGAVLYALTVTANIFVSAPMIGASGSVLGLIGACAVAAPQMNVLLFMVFPIRIRTLAIAVGVIYLLSVMSSENAADACHLGGLAVGALWVWFEAKGLIHWPSAPGSGAIGPSGRKWVNVRIRKGAWEKKLKRRQNQQAQLDAILQKIHEKGLGSLSQREKKILQQVSKDQT